MKAEIKKRNSLICPTCGTPLVPSVTEIAEKLKVDEETATGLREYLVEDMCAKLADTP